MSGYLPPVVMPCYDSLPCSRASSLPHFLTSLLPYLRASFLPHFLTYALPYPYLLTYSYFLTEDSANLAAFLLSDTASWMTGQVSPHPHPHPKTLTLTLTLALTLALEP